MLSINNPASDSHRENIKQTQPSAERELLSVSFDSTVLLPLLHQYASITPSRTRSANNKIKLKMTEKRAEKEKERREE